MKRLFMMMVLSAILLITTPTFAYTVQSGDTMTKIASDYHLSLQELADLNPQIKNLNLIDIGQTINTEKRETIKAREMKVGYSEFEKDLLARLVRAEAQGEPFEGKVAVAEVVLNRVDNPGFPKTIKDVIDDPGQFQPVQNGEINKPADDESIKAVAEALSRNRNDGGALFFYNPEISQSHWLDQRTTTMIIGHHVFKK